jgi:SAM-dependent methyltransferase
MSESNPANHGFYDKRYSDEWRELQDRVFGEAYDDYFGQSSLTTTADYDRIFGWLSVGSGAHVLDVACGGGAPALRLASTAGCSVTGIDINANAVDLAQRSALERRLPSSVSFVLQDARAGLPFADATFDALVCVDALAHIGNHDSTIGEWRRVLRPGGRLAFTDIVLTGPISNEEFANRSPSGPIVVAPLGFEEQRLLAAGLTLERREDLTPTLEQSARRHVDARARHAEELLKLEGQPTFDTLNRYRASIELLARERRLSHVAFVAVR